MNSLKIKFLEKTELLKKIKLLQKKIVENKFLILIVFLAIVLRFYRLGQIPLGFTWDEAAVGYNAWTLAHWARDETGKILPLAFRSFGDYKNPVHFYLTLPFVAIWGLNETAVRAPAATFGVLNVILLYFLGKELFQSKQVGLLASLFLAVSPFNLQFSRFNHELNFTLFFFMAGLFLFFRGLKKNSRLLPLSLLSLGICLFSYHSAKMIVPLMILLLIIVYFKRLLRIKKHFALALFLLIGFITLVVVIEPNLSGLARLSQTSASTEEVTQTWLYQKTGQEAAGRVEIAVKKYPDYFQPKFLFETGDEILRHSSQVVGTFYKTEIILLPLGLSVALYNLLKKKKKENLIVLTWAFLAPVPATFGVELTHVARAMFMTGSWHLISALGLAMGLKIIKNKYLRTGVLIGFLTLLGYLALGYLRYYFTDYWKRYAIEWQYGMREILEYVGGHQEFMKVYMTDAFMQPYIFYLFYLQTPLPEFLKTYEINETQSKPSNLIAAYDRYEFGTWKERESIPAYSILYILNPSHYDGLRYKSSFAVVKNIKYPDGKDAFFLVTLKDEKD